MKFTSTILYFMILLFAKTSYGQTTFVKKYQSPFLLHPFATVQTPGGDLIVVGQYDTIHPFPRAFVAKINAEGMPVWAKSISMGCRLIHATDVKLLGNGNILIAGDFSPCNDTIYNGYLLALTSSGNILWCRSVGGTEDDYVHSMTVTPSGDIVLAGTIDENYPRIWICRTDSNGNFKWGKQLGGFSVRSIANDIISDASENSYISGEVGLSFGDHGCYLLKLDSSGNLVWNRLFNDSAHATNESLSQAVLTPDNGIVVVGFSPAYPIFNIWKVFLAKFSTNAQLIWARTFQLDESSFFTKIIKNDDNTFEISANCLCHDADPTLLHVDADGNFMSATKCGSDTANLVWTNTLLQTYDHGFLTCLNMQFDNQMMIVKADANGVSACSSSSLECIQRDYVPAMLTWFVGAGYGGSDTISMTLTNLDLTDSLICFSTGVSDQLEKKKEINLSPNPTSTHLTITLPSNAKKVSVTITDLSGKIIYSATETATQKIEVSTKDFAGGVYAVRVQTAEYVLAEKVVVVK